ncbi:NACHT domain-containing protein [Pedobacter sp.]|uniref:NACHT domain-containing protein n=1 Tax=Pedobacter sp. TaxID=1411316 RepID=UPI0031CFE86F
MNYTDQNKIGQKIREELNTLCSEHPGIFNDENIELFFKIVSLPLDNPAIRLEGLQTRIPSALAKIFLEDSTKEEMCTYFPEFAKIEPFLKKILYLTDINAYNIVSSSKAGLAKCIDKLGLNPNGMHLSSDDIISQVSQPNFAVHVLRTYKLRNLESHVCILWTMKELYENIESALITYLYTIHLHSAFLSNLVEQEPNFESYLNKVVLDFEVWQKRFVHITGLEKFEEIGINAIESEEWGNSEKRILREGKIDDLRKTNQEPTMVVLGEPGMGKSTTLQYMAYHDAKKLLNSPKDDSVNLPVYLELKLLSKSETILDVAAAKIGLDEQKLVEYLVKGKITLFLDGLNEVLADLRKPIRNEIISIIENYDKTAVIITSRPLAYYNEFKASPVFILQRMEDKQVNEFLEKNCDNGQARAIIQNEIKNNQRLGKIVRVPLLLKMLINVVIQNKGIIPDNKVQIIKQFIQNLYDRETEKVSAEVDFRVIHRLLCFVGYKTRQKNESNVGWRMEELEAKIEDRIEKSRFKISAYEFLDFAIDLNILVKDENKYSFIHELYQEYYASEQIFRDNAIAK